MVEDTSLPSVERLKQFDGREVRFTQHDDINSMLVGELRDYGGKRLAVYIPE